MYARFQQVVCAIDRRDVLLTCLFCLVAGITSLILSAMIPPTLYDNDAWDVWFDTDLHRSYEVMTSRAADSRSKLHPFFAPIALPPTKILIKLGGIEPLLAVRVVLATFAAVWSGTLFSLLRSVGCLRLDTSIFTLLGLSSASTIYFFAALDTFLVGSITIMLALIWAAMDESGERSPLIEACISAATFGITVTNWIAGLFSTFYRRGMKEAMQISANALTIAVLFWMVQKPFFPLSEFFPGNGFNTERTSILSPEGLGPVSRVRSFFAHTMVMPEIQIVDRPSSGRWPLLLTQPSLMTSAGVFGDIALVLWGVLLLVGTFALVTLKDKPRLRLLLGTVLLGQLVLHLLFGEETFLYSPHWVPVLVAIIALSTLTKYRYFTIIMASFLCITASANNVLQFCISVRFLTEYESIVKGRRNVELRLSRPDDPWPHKAIPISGHGFRGYDLAAYEPGGGFWPAIDTFQLGFWVVDALGKPITTSHDFDPEDTAVEQTALPDGSMQIRANTPYYRVLWEGKEPRFWRLKLETFAPANEQPYAIYMMLRGVGWEFSRLYSVARMDEDLLLNSRWRVKVEPATADVRIGTEDQPGWLTLNNELRQVYSKGGWAFARLGPLRPGHSYEVTVFDERRDGSVDTLLGQLSYASSTPYLFHEQAVAASRISAAPIARKAMSGQ